MDLPMTGATLAKKRAAIIRVLKHIIAHPAPDRLASATMQPLTRSSKDPAIGNIAIPFRTPVVMFPSGEEALAVGSSLVIELPGATIGQSDRP
jgi:hypothetical protein